MNVQEVWQSEESLSAAYTELLSLSKFDRTKDASKLVSKLMAALVNPHPTFYDIREWVVANVKDFNIASQLLLNSQRGNIQFKLPELDKRVEELNEKYNLVSIMNPTAKGAKFADNPEAKEDIVQYNLALATLRNHSILKNWIGINSFRVTPISSTPALADLNNLSSLSISGLSEFCESKIWLLKHEAISHRVNLHQQDDGGYVAEGLIWPVYSKSGGDITPRSLMCRWLTNEVLSRNLSIYVVPKYDSLLTAGDELPQDLQEYVVEFKG